MANDNLPRYFNASHSAFARAYLEEALGTLRVQLIASGADARVFDHELGMLLARAACRMNLDLLNGAGATIERLEAVVAEMGAKLEQARIATGHVEARPLPVGKPDPARFRYMAPELIREELDRIDAESTLDRLTSDPTSAAYAAALLEGGEAPHVVGCRCEACRG